MMIIPRIIPVLLLKQNGLYKGEKFRHHKYIGDPINTIKIFNDKQVDELVILNIENSVLNKPIDIEYVQQIVSEAFMPVAYGGGIKDIETATQLFFSGVEKIILNTYAFINPDFIMELSKKFGSQSIVVSIDVKRDIFGKPHCYIYSGTKKIKGHPSEWAQKFQELGAGEIILNSIDRDGTMKGYDLDLIKQISSGLKIPIVACGGAGCTEHLKQALQAGASASAAGSMFVFKGSKHGILINYPNSDEFK